MIKYGFFNSVDGDRLYNADDMSNYFDGLISNGIYKNIGGAFQVIPGEGMTVRVLDGRAIINCKWVTNDSFENITLDAADANYNRIDAIVLRLDETNRRIILTTIKGTPASAPVAPAIGDNDLCLAYVTIAVGVSTITIANISDKRSWIKGIISSTGKLKKYQNTVTVSSAATTFSIGIDDFDSDTDILEVYRDGIYLVEGVDYTIANNSTIKTTSSISSGILAFVVHKIVP